MEFGEVVRRRGFKPSDRFDPQKVQVLTSLTRKILHLEERSESGSGRGLPDCRLRRIISPAGDDFPNHDPRPTRKVFGSSDFFAPSHPTVDEQKSRAKEISSSITDTDNEGSKGQSMFFKRKKKSVTWVHGGQGPKFEEEKKSVTLKGSSWTQVERKHTFPVGRIQDGPRREPPLIIPTQLQRTPSLESFQGVRNNPFVSRDALQRRSYNTVARGYTHDTQVYHPIFLC